MYRNCFCRVVELNTAVEAGFEEEVGEPQMIAGISKVSPRYREEAFGGNGSSDRHLSCASLVTNTLHYVSFTPPQPPRSIVTVARELADLQARSTCSASTSPQSIISSTHLLLVPSSSRIPYAFTPHVPPFLSPSKLPRKFLVFRKA